MSYKDHASRAKPSKFGNIKTDYEGDSYDSRSEARYAKQLDTLKNAKNDAQRVVKWERQIKYPFELNGVNMGHYRLDFLVEYADGRIEHVDVKGVRTPVYSLKKKMMLAFHGIKIIEVKPNEIL